DTIQHLKRNIHHNEPTNADDVCWIHCLRIVLQITQNEFAQFALSGVLALGTGAFLCASSSIFQLTEGTMNRNGWLISAFAILGLVTGPAAAQKKYDPGVSDTEIKIGNIVPYSGPASAYSMIGRTIAAYLNKVNTEGGINGRKVT